MLVLHVGYAKTGTTFLQRRFLPFLPDIHYMGRTYNENGTRKEDLLDLVAAVNGAPNVDPNQVRGELIVNMRDGVNVISQEALLLPYQIQKGAERLAHITRGIERRILITIRRQESMIWSRYVHDRTRTKSIIPSYSLGQALAPHGECSWPCCWTLKSQFDCKCKNSRVKVIPLDFLDYDRIFNIYADHFGAENVYVLPLEYTADKNRYFDLLEDVLDVRVPGEMRASIDTSERVNRGATMPELGADKAMLPWLDAHRLFAESNAALSDRLNLDLDKFGYFRPNHVDIVAPRSRVVPAPEIGDATIPTGPSRAATHRPGRA